MRFRIPTFLVLLVAFTPQVAAAQEASDRVPADFRNVISANPLLLMFEWFNAEYERWASPTSTFGFRGSLVTIDDNDEYFSGRAFFRYYPNGAFRSFFIGVDGGVTGVSIDESIDSNESETVFGLGIELGVNWLLGASRKFYVSLGAGVDRLFGGDLDDVSAAIPTLRLINIGFGF